mgnify:CR=1 FL=1
MQQLSTSPEDPAKRREALSTSNEVQRQRYASDPEYRERLLAASRKHRNEFNLERYHRIKDSRKRRWQQISEDPKRLEEYYKRYNAYQAKRKIEEPRFLLSDRLHKWTLGLKDRKDGVQWRSHEPIFYTEKEPHDCQYCSTRRGGAKLCKWQKMKPQKRYIQFCMNAHSRTAQHIQVWWTNQLTKCSSISPDNLLTIPLSSGWKSLQHQDPPAYSCHACFAARWPEGMPHNYEYRTRKDGTTRLARKK